MSAVGPESCSASSMRKVGWRLSFKRKMTAGVIPTPEVRTVSRQIHSKRSMIRVFPDCMVGLNKVMIIGNIGTDPEMRYTPNGNPVTSFRMATNRAYTTSDGERHEETEWFTIVAWNQLAEQCNQYLAKGRRAYVEGRLRSRTWESQDGQTRYRIEIIANRVLFLDRATGLQSEEAEAGGSTEQSEAGAGQESGAPVEAEDLPF